MKELLGDCTVLRVNGKTRERLASVMKLSSGFPAHGYSLDKLGNRIVLYNCDARGSMPFPVPLGPERCAEIVFDWLQTTLTVSQPDHDGDNEKGWLCYTECGGKIEPHGPNAFLAVEPIFVMRLPRKAPSETQGTTRRT